MKLPSLLFTLLIPALPAAERPDDHFRLGEAAISDGLWDVATLHFDALLHLKSLPSAEKSRAAIQLTEALVRGGQPGKALDLLGESFVGNHPSVPFWKGQALAGLGLLSEAAAELDIARSSDPSLASEAILTRVSILLALDHSEEALAALRPLISDPDPSVSVSARLHEAAILLDLGRPEDAAKAMPDPSSVPAKLHPEAVFLQAQLQLATNNPAEAIGLFSSLLDDPVGQSLPRHHAAALGFADALAMSGSPEKASESLLVFIQENPASPLLGTFFSRLLDWLPAIPNPNHPTLDRLTGWSLPAQTPKTWLRPADYDALFPSVTQDNRLVHSLLTRAIAVRRIPDPTYQKEAKHLLTRLILEYPEHPLVPEAMLRMARWLVSENQPAPAFAWLDALRDHPSASTHGGEASFLKALAAYESGSFAEAAGLFSGASAELEGPSSRSSLLNAAISRFRESGVMTVALTSPDGKPVSPELQSDLELERALSATPPATARTAIEDFLTRHPKHPRVPEARLAAANAAMAVQPPDLSMARAQLDTIAADPAATSALPASRLALARLRLTELSGDPPATIAAARSFLETYPGDPGENDASLTLGLALFHTENYNDARLVLEKLARDNTDPSRAQAAWLLAARSAALVGTPQSRDEALTLFGNAAEEKGTLSPIITMEKARLLIDMNRPADATAFVRTWYASLPESDPLRIPAGLLFGEAVNAQGAKNPALLAEALAIYDQLLKHPEAKPALTNRIQYLRGTTLEHLPSSADPTRNREGEAFDAYYTVLHNSPNPPAEWDYLERSGLRALDILVKAEKWTSAINIAKKIAEFKGPHAAEAAARARDIQLKTMIWDD